MSSKAKAALSFLHHRFGPAGVVAVLALALALGGGAAFAVKKPKVKVVRGPIGPRGPAGPAGAAGPAGPAGPAGAAGAEGEQGEQGIQGVKGDKGDKGDQGDAGPAGPAGSPWSAGSVLPAGSMISGTYAGIVGYSDIQIPVSFPVSLASPLAGDHTIVLPIGGSNANCSNSTHPGTPSATNPEAAAGYLCIFTVKGTAAESVTNPATGAAGASTAGAILYSNNGAGDGQHYGTWAVAS